ncbi:MAG: hypothetical protein Q7R44_00515 [bacterium]|nr:hypothetical protein [bacterium]
MSLIETAVRKIEERDASLAEQAQVRDLCVQLRQEWETRLKEHGKPIHHMSGLGEVMTYPLFLIFSKIFNGLSPSQLFEGLVIERQIETHTEHELQASVFSLGKNPETSPQIVVMLEGLSQTLFLFKNRGAIVPGFLAHKVFNYERNQPLMDSFGPTSLENVVKFKEEILDPLKLKLAEEVAIS